ncbi:hypothetical protein M5X17_27605 [Paenibacillus alvei]|uniref:helix-turn-helix domain-containing protein n=1 Tax=Paenibacillus alvei TaxID=44250 RepID=UPI0022823736|nr:hypothetical protein [Paenibacillus alvei]MCY9737472.1 hypothetical protein [Paenibacillus alvei]
MRTVKKALQEAIVNARKKKGYSQKEVAYWMDMKLTDYRLVEKVEKQVSDQFLRALAAKLEVNDEKLIKSYQQVYTPPKSKNVLTMYYDRQGNSIDFNEWSKLSNDDEYRILGQTTLKNNKSISTLWIGLDSNRDNYKRIFETMVFNPDGEINIIGRCETEEEAQFMHDNTIKQLKEDV